MKKKFILVLLIFICFSNVTLCVSFSSRLKTVHRVFVKNAKKISAKDAFFGVAIFSLVGMTIKLFKQCINMRSEIFTLRNLVAQQGHFDLENLRRELED